MKFHTNFWFLKDKKLIQPEKIIIFEKKPEISLKVRLFGVGKKSVSLMEGFPSSGKGWGGEVNRPSWVRRIGNFTNGGGSGLTGEGNLRRSDFDDSNLFLG